MMMTRYRMMLERMHQNDIHLTWFLLEVTVVMITVSVIAYAIGLAAVR